MERLCAERSTQPGRRRGGRTHGLSAARRGAASPRRCSASSGGRGRRAGNAAASSAWEAGRRTRRGKTLPPLPLSRPLPGSSFAAACFSLPYPSGCHKPSALPSPRWEKERGGTQGPGSPSWGAGRGGRRAPLPGREAVLKLGIRSVILEPGSNPDCPPPSCRKHNPFARMPSSPGSPPLQIEMVQAPGAPAPRELESGFGLAGLPSGPNTK